MKKGTTIVSGVVPEWVKRFLDNSKRQPDLASRSKVIGFILTSHAEQRLKEERENGRL